MNTTRLSALSLLVIVAACGGGSSNVPPGAAPPDGGTGGDDASASGNDAGDNGDAGMNADTSPPPPPPPPGDGGTQALTLCKVSDPGNVTSAFNAVTGPDSVAYSCKETCADAKTCAVGLVDQNGQPITSLRGNLPMQALAFVVDGMAGHLAFTPDGTDVVVTHAGVGGITSLNGFDRQLQSMSNLRTVTLGWERGSGAVPGATWGGGAGWFTRKDAKATSVRALVARPAAALQWIKDNFAAGQKLGTVGGSMGTMATFGAKVWYGLDAILDYQMLIGGPGFSDVNAGCGRVHIAQGYCDVDVSPCTGNPMSSFGNDDPVCPGANATNNCRVPTIMAQETAGSGYNDIINYVAASSACAATMTDQRDPSLDASSLAFTVTNWNLHGRIDLVADEGGVQPPNADQGMGEGHMMYIYAQIQSAKGWIDNDGTHHGDAFGKTPALVTAAAKLVIAGMGH